MQTKPDSGYCFLEGVWKCDWLFREIDVLWIAERFHVSQ